MLLAYCKHGLLPETCAICNPVSRTYRRAGRPKKITEDPELKLAEQNYELTKNRCKNHDELWDVGDYEILFIQMEGAPEDTNSVKFRKLALETAVLLNRTVQSIWWHYQYMFRNLNGENRKEHVFKKLVEREALLSPYKRKGTFLRIELFANLTEENYDKA